MIRRFLSIVFCGLFMVGCGDDGKTLNVGTSADYPPFEFMKDGEIVGFEIDLIREIGKRMDYDIKIQDMSFDSIVASLQSQRIHLSISNITKTKERAERVDFTDSYHTIKSYLVVKKNTNYKSESDFKGKSIGSQFGTTFEMMVQNMDGVIVRSLARIPDLLQDLKNDRIQAILVGEVEARAMITSDTTLRMFNLESRNDTAHIALPKNSELTAKVNDALNAIKSDGTLETLQKKWNI